MASGTFYVDGSIRTEEGRVIKFGRILCGVNAHFNAVDFQLRTIRSVTLTPWYAKGIVQPRRIVVMAGSIGSAGVFSTPPGGQGTPSPSGAYLRVRAYHISKGSSSAATGTFYLGTLAGSFRASFIIVGE